MTTAQQLREALGKMTQGEYAIRDNHALLVLNETFPGGCEQVADGLKRKDVESIAYIINILPFFLDEYENLEREASSGRALAEAVLGWEAEAISMGWNGEDDIMALTVLRRYVEQYRSDAQNAVNEENKKCPFCCNYPVSCPKCGYQGK